eukprot:snap_masked-scaffold_16-processed-gene-1.31-mRNA-1 protein AED:1.00 eAED:1.00 QI:0/0/0/0/1/1/3/0/62
MQNWMAAIEINNCKGDTLRVLKHTALPLIQKLEGVCINLVEYQGSLPKYEARKTFFFVLANH